LLICAIDLTTHKERKNAFDKYCKVRAVELKDQTISKAQSAKESFLAFLSEKIVDLRTTYEEFFRKHKKDPKFLTISNDQDRKSLFKEHIAKAKQAELEKRKQEKKNREEAFFTMLKETGKVGVDSLWKDVKRNVETDKRCTVVPTPVEREELFRQYIKNLKAEKEGGIGGSAEEALRDRERRALQEREEAVRKQKQELNREARGKQNKLRYEESVTLLQTLLVDLIRSHDVTWREALPVLERDPRFAEVQLRPEEKERVFDEHVSNLFARRLAAFHELIKERTMLTTPFENIEELCTLDPRATRLERSIEELERLYNNFQKDRTRQCREDLETALLENTFITFHVKTGVQNSQVQAVAKGLKEAEDGDEWRLISLDEIKAVLKVS
jgi:transcription elongation regulator 1